MDNQEFGNILPVFKEISVGGNALERVLALEIDELAEAIQAEKKSSIQFQRYTLLLRNSSQIYANSEALRLKFTIFFVH
ncbi:hypothetical protein PIB30_068957 [Stylosanthes scabra]|uniref:Uncharacterized protein n=1 Tax=Stylosanthes scabra TaxID=79078 RepID=A0ABU6SNM0_9FABA|nr:hypothetical protein [Stylosanthes scabra]